MSAESEHLIRLSQVLADRGIPIDRVLEGVSVAGSTNAFLGVSALSPRCEVMLPVRGDVLAAIGPGLALPEPPPARGVLKLVVEPDRSAVAVVTIGSVPPEQAVEELVSDAARPAWLAVVAPLVAVGGARVMNRTRWLSEQRAEISVAFSPRVGYAEAEFAQAIDEHMGRIGLPAAHRELWPRLYKVSGIGRTLSIVTECRAAGPTASFSALGDQTTFDQAIDLAKVMYDADQARVAAVGFGAIAGGLSMNRLMGVEARLGLPRPELVVWLPPRIA